MHASVTKLLPRIKGIVSREDDLCPNQSHNSPSKEAVSPFEVIVIFMAHGGVGKYEHHQE